MSLSRASRQPNPLAGRGRRQRQCRRSRGLLAQDRVRRDGGASTARAVRYECEADCLRFPSPQLGQPPDDQAALIDCPVAAAEDSQPAGQEGADEHVVGGRVGRLAYGHGEGQALADRQPPRTADPDGEAASDPWVSRPDDGQRANRASPITLAAELRGHGQRPRLTARFPQTQLQGERKPLRASAAFLKCLAFRRPSQGPAQRSWSRRTAARARCRAR
jgi:hypothetical protein